MRPALVVSVVEVIHLAPRASTCAKDGRNGNQQPDHQRRVGAERRLSSSGQ
jgi:hypothetical protein